MTDLTWQTIGKIFAQTGGICAFIVVLAEFFGELVP